MPSATARPRRTLCYLTTVKLDSVLKTESTAPKEATATVDDDAADAPDGDSQSKLDVHLRETLRILKDALHTNPTIRSTRLG